MQLPKMHPKQFCQKWVPVLRDHHQGEKRFSWECGTVIEAVTGYKRSTVYGWLGGNMKAPITIQRFLGLLDILLEIDDEELIRFRNELKNNLLNLEDDDLS